MSIASAITAAQGRVADCYTAISDKGGTLPATQNLANMPTAIGSIQTGYIERPSYQVSNGVASRRSGALTGDEFSDIISIGKYGLYRNYACCFYFTGGVNFSSLETVDDYGLNGCFDNCSRLNGTVDVSSLKTIGKQGLMYFLYSCINIIGVINFTNLTTIGDSGLQYAFAYDSKITDIYFNSLTTTSFGSYTNQFIGMLNSTGSSSTRTLHFPSNLQSTISGLSGYPTFGGTSGYVVLAFDLPATS